MNTAFSILIDLLIMFGIGDQWIINLGSSSRQLKSSRPIFGRERDRPLDLLKLSHCKFLLQNCSPDKARLVN